MRRGCRERFPPPPRFSEPDMHHGTCVTHVPWCMAGSLTSGFLWNRCRGKRSRHSRRMRNPWFCVSGKRPMEAAVTWHEYHDTPISQISQCIRQASHHTPCRRRNVHTCANFCYKAVLVEIWDWRIVEFVQQVSAIRILDETAYQVWKSTMLTVILLLKSHRCTYKPGTHTALTHIAPAIYYTTNTTTACNRISSKPPPKSTNTSQK